MIDWGGVIWDMAAGGGGSQEANVPGQKLAEFCAQLDDYTPTVSNITLQTSTSWPRWYYFNNVRW